MIIWPFWRKVSVKKRFNDFRSAFIDVLSSYVRNVRVFLLFCSIWQHTPTPRDSCIGCVVRSNRWTTSGWVSRLGDTYFPLSILNRATMRSMPMVFYFQLCSSHLSTSSIFLLQHMAFHHLISFLSLHHLLSSPLSILFFPFLPPSPPSSSFLSILLLSSYPCLPAPILHYPLSFLSSSTPVLSHPAPIFLSFFAPFSLFSSSLSLLFSWISRRHRWAQSDIRSYSCPHHRWVHRIRLRLRELVHDCVRTHRVLEVFTRYVVSLLNPLQAFLYAKNIHINPPHSCWR